MSASSHSSRSRPYIPVIGGLLLQTLLHLVEGLENPCNRVGYPNEVQTSNNDSQYTLAIVALAVLVLESAINRARFLRNEHGRKSASKAFAEIITDPELHSHVQELFVVRDVIAHNHIWDSEIIDSPDGLKHARPPILIRGYGDEKFSSLINQATRQTKVLGLNIFPTRIWREDVLKVLGVLDSALAALDDVNPSYFGAKNTCLAFSGEFMSFPEAVARIRGTKLGI